jgi:hypothetical protein
MAVALEFIDFIVQRKAIDEKYPGGWQKCFADHAGLIGGRIWHDAHLFRDGAMSGRDIEVLVASWQNIGLEPFLEVDGKKTWKDFCVVEGMFGGPTLPCDWIEISQDGYSAYLKGTEPGEIAGPNR